MCRFLIFSGSSLNGQVYNVQREALLEKLNVAEKSDTKRIKRLRKSLGKFDRRVARFDKAFKQGGLEWRHAKVRAEKKSKK